MRVKKQLLCTSTLRTQKAFHDKHIVPMVCCISLNPVGLPGGAPQANPQDKNVSHAPGKPKHMPKQSVCYNRGPGSSRHISEQAVPFQHGCTKLCPQARSKAD